MLNPLNILKRIIISFIIADNFILNLPKRFIFRSRYVLKGKCKQCGNCCREIYLEATPRQIASPLFRNIATKWLEWIFDFKLIKFDFEDNFFVFSCKNQLPDLPRSKAGGKCGNYFWRPNICRNYPIVDYFKEPVFLPGCGYSAELRR